MKRLSHAPNNNNSVDSSQSTKEHRAYKCLNGAKEGQLACPDMSVRAEWVEAAVVEVIGHVAQTSEMRHLLAEEIATGIERQDAGLQKEKTQLWRKLSEVEEKFERWVEGFSQGIISASQFAIYNQKLQQQEQEARERLDQVERELEGRIGRQLWLEQVREQFESFPLVWEELDNDEKRQVLSLLIEDGELKAAREGRDIKLSIKPQLLPVQERTIIYRTHHGTSRTKATGLQRLTLWQMVLLHYAGEGKSCNECAELMGCKVHSIHTLEKTIRNNLGDISWKDAVEMARERVQANLHQLPLGKSGRVAAEYRRGDKFLSPVLMEVFELFAKGAQVPEVAERLHLLVTTVQGRRARILKHFGTSSMLEAVETAEKQGILQKG